MKSKSLRWRGNVKSKLGVIAEYLAQLVVLDSSATVVPQWNGSLRKQIINYCYRGPQSHSGGHRNYIIKCCCRGLQSRSGELWNYLGIIEYWYSGPQFRSGELWDYLSSMNYCYRGPQSCSGGLWNYVSIFNSCYRGPQSRSGGVWNYVSILTTATAVGSLYRSTLKLLEYQKQLPPLPSPH